jgi:hypothetical protein
MTKQNLPKRLEISTSAQLSKLTTNSKRSTIRLSKILQSLKIKTSSVLKKVKKKTKRLDHLDLVELKVVNEIASE